MIDMVKLIGRRVERILAALSCIELRWMESTRNYLRDDLPIGIPAYQLDRCMLPTEIRLLHKQDLHFSL